jgi:hypothetical protein
MVDDDRLEIRTRRGSEQASGSQVCRDMAAERRE